MSAGAVNNRRIMLRSLRNPEIAAQAGPSEYAHQEFT